MVPFSTSPLTATLLPDGMPLELEELLDELELEELLDEELLDEFEELLEELLELDDELLDDGVGVGSCLPPHAARLPASSTMQP